jgi:Ankyrin repeats (many copies)/Ankyrin repeat
MNKPPVVISKDLTKKNSMGRTDVSVVVEADTLEEALTEIKRQISQNSGWILADRYIEEGLDTISAESPTLQEAVRKAEEQLPKNAVIEFHWTTPEARHYNTFDGFTEQEVLDQVTPTLKNNETIDGITLRKKGGKGIMGIGKTPNTYDVCFMTLAQATYSFFNGKRLRVNGLIGFREFSRIRAWIKDGDVERLKALKALLGEHPTLVNYIDDEYYGTRPIHYAVYYRNVEMVKLLIARGANLDLEGKPGSAPKSTPLPIAIEKGFAEIVELLAPKCADVHPINSGFSPLHLVCRGKWEYEYKHISPSSGDLLRMAQALVINGADINLESKGYFKTPLSYAIENNLTEVGEYLKSEGGV